MARQIKGMAYWNQKLKVFERVIYRSAVLELPRESALKIFMNISV